MTTEDNQDPIADAPFQVVGEDDVKDLEKKKVRIDDVMEIIKEHGLENDDEFMKEIQEAVDASLKN